jgi:hypothetical protein
MDRKNLVNVRVLLILFFQTKSIVPFLTNSQQLVGSIYSL